MNTSPTPDCQSETDHTASHNLLHTVLLAGAVVFIPLLIGILVVLIGHRLAPAALPPPADMITSLTNRLYDGSATNVRQLVALRRDLRSEGFNTEEVNLRLWAAHAAEPELLFRVPPPDTGKNWNWYVAQNGLQAIAVSIQRDAIERRTVGLYDLITEQWTWTNALPWPDTHEQPHVFGKHLVLRYSKNAMRFALEVDADGRIVSIDTLGKGSYDTASVLSAHPLFPGNPVAVKNGVFFTSDAGDGTLLGYAQDSLPGLRYAGKGDTNTIFSGNGRLKFTAAEGRVTVSDSLTQTVLQQIDAWSNSTNTAVTATLTTHDGSRLNVFLRTEFEPPPLYTREWSVAIDLYRGTVAKSMNADAQFAKPKRTVSRQALSPDGHWQLAVNAENELTVTSLPQNRDVARVALETLGLRSPIDHVTFLEEGRHVVLRQNDNFWLLDFTLARSYGDLLSRRASCSCTNTPSATATAPDALLATAPEGFGVSDPFDPDTLSYTADTAVPVPSYLSLRAELFAANQAWGFAASLLEKTQQLQEFDTRAPRANPLLRAQYYILSGQRQKARRVCREALGELIADTTEYNRMIRYQLQGLLFAEP